MKQSDYYPTKTYKTMILKHLLTFNFDPPPASGCPEYVSRDTYLNKISDLLLKMTWQNEFENDLDIFSQL